MCAYKQAFVPVVFGYEQDSQRILMKIVIFCLIVVYWLNNLDEEEEEKKHFNQIVFCLKGKTPRE